MIEALFGTDMLSSVSSRSAAETESASVLYISRYAPNANIMLTKGQIAELAENVSVTDINYIDTTSNLESVEVLSDSEDDEADEPYDMTFFDVTGLSATRDAQGLNGFNMKVGMAEPFHPLSTISDTGTVTKVYNTTVAANMHASLVASIMIGRTIDENGTLLFEGAIPSANLYSAAIDAEECIKAGIEALLDEGVTAINCSFSYPKNNPVYNEYGDIAKWYDHISAHHNVHLVLTASNAGALGVVRSNNSYNAIVVGACDNNGTILESSSYITLNNFMNKPDIVAPGIVSAPIYGSSGTSFAAPMVTSAVIQLSQASPVLLSNPTLMKAVLLGNAKITSAMSSDNNVYSTANGTASAISQVYGAGMLNVSKAYSSFISDGYYKTGTMSPYSSGVSYDRVLSKSVGKTIRVCLTWNKMISTSDDHINGTITEHPLDTIKLTVTTPSGTVYSSQNLYDNKQMISFVATENGTYTFDVFRFGVGNSGEIVRYSLAYSKQN